MSKNGKKIKGLIRGISHRPNEVMSGTVVSVDESTYTMVVLPTDTDDEANAIQDVSLGAVSENGDGVIVIPAKDSNVVICTVDGDGVYTLVKTSIIDKIMLTIGGETLVIDKDGHVFDGGKNGGMVIVGKLVAKVNALEDKLNDLVSKYNGHTHVYSPGPSSPVPTAPTTATETPLSAKTTVSDIENTKVKH